MNKPNLWSSLIQFIKNAGHKLHQIAHIRWLRWTVQIIVIALCLFYLIINLKNAREILSGIKPDYAILVLSLGLTVVAVFLGATGWWFTLRSLGQPVAWLGSARTHCLSNLAKYIPGYAWQLLGKAYLTNQMGVPNRAIGVGMVLELLIILLTGFFLGLIFLPADLALHWFNSQVLINILPTIKVFSLILLGLFPIIIYIIIKDRFRSQSEMKIVPSMIVAATLVSVLAWLFFGLSFWLLGVSLTPLSYANIPLFIFTLTASLIISLLTIFVPGGIGVRESIMVFILGAQYLPAPVAVIIAAFSRVVVILSELLSALVIVFIVRQPWNNYIKGFLVRK